MPPSPIPLIDTDRLLPGTGVTVLIGTMQGKYPTSNSMQVVGTDSAILIDPSLDVHARGGAPANIDRLLISHAHEDHLAGIDQFDHATICAHTHDTPALHSIENLLEVYGMPEPVRSIWKDELLRDFHYTPRLDATSFEDGDVFDLGGRTVTVIHLPGHTRGHCGFLVEPDGVLFVADIELSSFGPYYGDHWSDLEDFERAMDKAAEVDAKWYVTSHHKGIVEDRHEFQRALEMFRGVIAKRERRLLDYLDQPRTIADIVAHRIIYRPGTTGVLWIDHVEETSAKLHLQRMLRIGEVTQLESGAFQAS
jgi:glyoxylase-like metal-dependent hydrolase (beta-lactamase superfamily II)